MGRKKKNINESYNEKVIKSDNENDCYGWAASLGHNGYALMWDGVRLQRGHRWVWEQHYGEIPEGMVIRHTCNTRHCTNIRHLQLGSQADNIRDRDADGNTAKGEVHGMAKLTESDVKEIRAQRANKVKLRDIAEQFGITMANVSNIAKRRIWKCC